MTTTKLNVRVDIRIGIVILKISIMHSKVNLLHYFYIGRENIFPLGDWGDW